MSDLPKAVTPLDVYKSEAEVERQMVGSIRPHVEAINKMLLHTNGVKKIDRPKNLNADLERKLRDHFSAWEIHTEQEDRGTQWDHYSVDVWVFTPNRTANHKDAGNYYNK